MSESTMEVVVHESASPVSKKQCCIIVRNLVKVPTDRFPLNISSSSSIKYLHTLVSNKVRFMVGTFDLIFINPNSDMPNGQRNILLNDEDTETTLETIGFSTETKNVIEIKERSGVAVEMMCPAMPPENDQFTSKISEPPPYSPDIHSIRNTTSQRRMAISADDEKTSNVLNYAFGDTATGELPKLVGLVNQAMTCYLNSLIQTLFMTPEFRNALYKWEYDSNDDTSTSIPFQLQRLFLLLQTSNKQSVETTGLTRSFGWDSSEAWQQHDIQELCRVMFDALEKKFEGTVQADLIKQLYEGTMKDYVQCCECSHESARNDTFLDVPITIRPFGSTKTYKSVIEGLNAFVEPETLDDTNQYFCEKCDKKCDAKKGLKFTKFPYLLTLQLKRFDFDYSTMHRIKLNDRMTFPQILNLNSFIDDNESSPSSRSSICDDNEEMSPHEDIPDEETSSHDSGHVIEQGSTSTSSDVFPSNQRNSSEEEEEMERSSVDEGIYVESQQPSAKRRKGCPPWWRHSETIKRYLKDGPFVYELFSVMIHSGSAAGGHYYAYIKSFENNRWYSFNDQIVSPVTQQDIEKVYGGSSYPRTSSYYSSYSSSTNAYMVMYRQICPARNASFMQNSDLPQHIVTLLNREKEEEKQRQIRYEIEKNQCSIRVFCRHPSILKSYKLIESKTFEFHKDISLLEGVTKAHKCFELDSNIIPVEHCRLVRYDHIQDVLDRSYDLDTEDANCTLSQLLGGVKTTYLFDLLLETRGKNEVFERYERGGVTLKIHTPDYRLMCFNNPILLRTTERSTVLELKKAIAQRLNYPLERLLIVWEKYSGDFQLLLNDKKILKQEGFFRSVKIFVGLMTDEEFEKRNSSIPLDIHLESTALWSIIEKMTNVITIAITFPPEISEEHHLPMKSFSETSQAPTSSKPLNQVEGSPSSDEGVGSLGGSGNGDSPPSQVVDIHSDIYSPQANCMNSSDNENFSQNQDNEDVSANESNWFWKIPEIASGNATSPSLATEVDDGRKGERKRNNSYENELLSLPNLIDLPGKIQEKLEGYAPAVSPTSSLRCEDSGSSHSGQNSFITDVDFEMDNATSIDDHQQNEPPASTVESEGGSLSTSCSTLDSTDTLCNTSDPNKLPSEDNLITSFQSISVMPLADAKSGIDHTIDPDQGQVKPHIESMRPILPKTLPGRAVPCSGLSPIDNSASDYDKALRYVDEAIDCADITSSLHTKDSRITVAGTGDPSDSANDLDKVSTHRSELKNIPVSNTSKKCTVPGTDASLLHCKPCRDNFVSSNKDYLSINLDTKNIKCQTCITASKTSNTIVQTGDNRISDANTRSSSDPDSGEGMDKLKPLFSTLSTFTNPCQAHPSNNSDKRVNRERTMSSSSTASDSWGVNSDLLSRYDFFKVISTSNSVPISSSDPSVSRPSKILSVEIDKRMTLLGLKRHIAPIIGIPIRRFCVYRQYSGGPETEITNASDDFRLCSDGLNLVIRLGRALRKDEYRCKLFMLTPEEEETSKLLMNWVIQRGTTVQEACKLLSTDLAEQNGVLRDPERIRIRKKTWRSPGQIYLSTEKFGTDISVYGSLEFFVEFLSDPEIKKKRNDLVLFTRRWFPSKLCFSDFHEMVVGEGDEDTIAYLGYSIDQMIECVSSSSGIPPEHLRIAKGRGIFPYRVSVLTADTDLEWLPTETGSHAFHISEDGMVLFYKDNREELKVCSEEQKREIEKQEEKFDTSSSFKYTGSSSNFSSSGKPFYRREKALKIYTVDTAPSSKTKAVITEL